MHSRFAIAAIVAALLAPATTARAQSAAAGVLDFPASSDGSPQALSPSEDGPAFTETEPQAATLAVHPQLAQADPAMPRPPRPTAKPISRPRHLVGVTPLMLAFEGPIGGAALELVRARGEHLQFSLLHADASWSSPHRVMTSAGLLGLGAKTNLGREASTELGLLVYPLSFATLTEERGSSVGVLLTKVYLRQYFGLGFLEVGAQSPLFWYTEALPHSGLSLVRGYLGFGIDL